MKNDTSNIVIAVLLIGLVSLPLMFKATAKHKNAKVEDTDILMQNTMQKLQRMKEVSSRVNQSASNQVSGMRSNIEELKHHIVDVNKMLVQSESKNKYYELAMVKMDSVVRGVDTGEPFTVLAIETLPDSANRK